MTVHEGICNFLDAILDRSIVPGMIHSLLSPSLGEGMRTSWLLGVTAILIAAMTPVSAQTYTIKLKTYADEGKSVTYRNVEEESGITKFLDADGKVVNEIKPKTTNTVYTETILSRGTGDGRAAKYVRVYEKATETQEGKARALSHQGRTVVFERKEGDYRIGVVGTPALATEDLEKLIEKANDAPNNERDGDKAITPKKAVAVGETWKVEIKAIALLMKDYEFDMKSSQAEAKLVKVFQRGTTQFGVIELTLDLTITEYAKLIKFEKPLTMKLAATMERAIDGSSLASKTTTKIRIKGTGTLENGGKKYTAIMEGESTGQSDDSEEFDDPKARKVPAVKFTGPNGDWSEFTSKEGQFSASFPGKPKLETEKIEKTGGETVTLSVERDEGRIVYAVVYLDSGKQDPKKLLTAFVDRFAADTTKKTDVMLNGHAGIELVRTIKAKSGGTFAMTQLIYVTDDRVYQVMATAADSAKEKLEVRKFLDSFKLTTKAEPKKDDK